MRPRDRRIELETDDDGAISLEDVRLRLLRRALLALAVGDVGEIEMVHRGRDR